MKPKIITSTKLTAGDKFKIFLLRKVIMPLVEVPDGGSYPAGRLIELSRSNLAEEKLHYIKPNKTPPLA